MTMPFILPVRRGGFGVDGNDDNTVLLLHCDGADGHTDFGDSARAGGRHTITVAGTAQGDTAQKKFGSASLLLDGNSDYLTAPDHADWAFGAYTNPFTLEAWIRFNSLPTSGNTMTILSQYSSGSNFWHFSVQNTGANYVLWHRSAPAASNWTGVFSPVVDTWYHVVVIRPWPPTNATDGWALLVDGVVAAEGREQTTFPDPGSVLSIGRNQDGSNYFDGWIDEIRISNVARWTAPFSVPTAQYESDVNTKLLLHCDGADEHVAFNDSAGKAVTVVGTAQGDTAQRKFGTASLLISSSGNDYLSLADHADFQFGSGNFTIDMWLRWNAKVAGYMGVIQKYVDINDSWYLTFNFTADNYVMFRQEEATVETILISGVIPQTLVPGNDIWFHLALIRGWGGNANDFAITIDGKVAVTGTNATAINAFGGTVVEIGRQGASSEFDGWFDEIRISKGVARWTKPFSRPVGPY
jgi:hypothetical protein